MLGVTICETAMSTFLGTVEYHTILFVYVVYVYEASIFKFVTGSNVSLVYI